MDFDNKELCQNLGELVLMKVAGELDAEQYEACTEYMLKEAAVIPGSGMLDNVLNWVKSQDWGGIANAVAAKANQGIEAIGTGTGKIREITSNLANSSDDIKKLTGYVTDAGKALGFTAKETAPALTTGKALGLIGAGGVGSLGLANLLSAAGKANAYDPYEY